MGEFENIDEFDEFPAIRQYFPYQIFCILTAHEFVAIRLHSKKIYVRRLL